MKYTSIQDLSTMDTENKAFVLEKILLMHYSIDVKLNDIFKCTASSFNKASTLLKAIFAPLHTHCSNTAKITASYGAASINLLSVTESISMITEKVQVHDVIEQRLRHIRQINTEIIKEIISLKKSGGSQTNEGHLKMIAEINAAQLASIENEYHAYCQKLDAGLSSITTYLSDWEHLTFILKNSEESETTFLIHRNSNLRDRIDTAITSFQADTSYRKVFSNTTGELTKFFTTISSLVKTADKVSTSNPMLTLLHNLYTTQREREIFNTIVNPGIKNNLSSQKHSDVDIF
jgi:hypothetical protein